MPACRCTPPKTTTGSSPGSAAFTGSGNRAYPELLASDYDLLTGSAPYLDNPTDAIWAAVIRSHAAVDSVFLFEKQATAALSEDRKYGYEQRGSATLRAYSREFSRDYHRRLSGQVERQLRYASRLIGAFWYTCWVDGGSPDLSKMAAAPSLAEQQRLEKEAQQTAVAPVVSAPGHDE